MPQTGAADAGFSLVTVLWILVALSAILAPITIRARTQALHTTSVMQIDRLDLLARGIANVLVARLADNRSGGSVLPRNSTPVGCSAGVLDIRVAVQDHAGLVSLNHALKPALTAALTALGRDNGNASTLADAMITNRSYRPANNRTAPDIDGGPKHAPFESVSEVFEITGLRSASYRDLHRTFSAHATSNTLALPVTPKHLADAARRFDGLEGSATGGSSAYQTVSVEVRRGEILGQFNGIFETSTRGVPYPVETWRYDDARAAADSDGQRCADLFGMDITAALEAFE